MKLQFVLLSIATFLSATSCCHARGIARKARSIKFLNR